MENPSKTPLATQIAQFEAETMLVFRPSRNFYERGVGVNRVRFWQLVDGKKEPTLTEAQRLASYFKTSLDALFSAKTKSEEA